MIKRSPPCRETRNAYLVTIRFAQQKLLMADDGVKKLIQERAGVAELFASAVEGGIRTLKTDGLEKIMMGLTDLNMVRQVCIK